VTTYTHATNGSGTVTIDSGYLSGTVESAVVDLSSVASRWWSVLVESHESDSVSLGECTFALGSGEARMRTLLSREASPYAPGAYFADTITDLGRLDDAAQALCGPVGSQGENTRAVTEARFSDDNVSWSTYQRWVTGWRAARYVQVRVTLYRRGARWQRSMTQCLIKVGETA
jgi:hypothetical protein